MEYTVAVAKIREQEQTFLEALAAFDAEESSVEAKIEDFQQGIRIFNRQLEKLKYYDAVAYNYSPWLRWALGKDKEFLRQQLIRAHARKITELMGIPEPPRHVPDGMRGE